MIANLFNAEHANVRTVWDRKTRKTVETTQFEMMLDNIDKALNLRMFLATQERAHYSDEAYEAAQTATMRMFDMITGDSDISWQIDDLWLDSNSDIRYILEMMFTDAKWDAQNKAELDAEIRAERERKACEQAGYAGCYPGHCD